MIANVTFVFPFTTIVCRGSGEDDLATIANAAETVSAEIGIGTEVLYSANDYMVSELDDWEEDQ